MSLEPMCRRTPVLLATMTLADIEDRWWDDRWQQWGRDEYVMGPLCISMTPLIWCHDAERCCSAKYLLPYLDGVSMLPFRVPTLDGWTGFCNRLCP